MIAYTLHKSTRLQARKFFKEKGATEIVYLTHKDRYGKMITNNDLEYYFKDGREIGYFCAPTENFVEINRTWGNHLTFTKLGL